MGDLSALYGVFGDISATLDSLVLIEDKKITCALARDLSALDAVMKEEQAQVMKLRGLEKKRETEQSAAGLGGLDFRGLIDSAPVSERARLEEYHAELNRKTADLKELLAAAKAYIERNIAMIDALIGELAEQKGNES